ncbi:conserved hypothetical protein [Ricinus communis]|uniref:Uncharacterized protein n=1 Tax=Ricinus communis TaxID=3988 RepID=B9SDF3_RICCO|nr:conserved hypothetical protein [Ricinus communis]
MNGASAGVDSEKENINRDARASSSRSETTSNRENIEDEGEDQGMGLSSS